MHRLGVKAQRGYERGHSKTYTGDEGDSDDMLKINTLW